MKNGTAFFPNSPSIVLLSCLYIATIMSSSSSSLQQRNFSIIFIIISLIFWIWAIVNTIKNHRLDLGIVSFLSVLITHILLFCYHHQSNANSNCASCAVLCTHLFVTLNYVLGVYVALWTDIEFKPERQIGFAMYCGVAALLWLISSIIGYKIYENGNSISSSISNQSDAPAETSVII